MLQGTKKSFRRALRKLDEAFFFYDLLGLLIGRLDKELVQGGPCQIRGPANRLIYLRTDSGGNPLAVLKGSLTILGWTQEL